MSSKVKSQPVKNQPQKSKKLRNRRRGNNSNNQRRLIQQQIGAIPYGQAQAVVQQFKRMEDRQYAEAVKKYQAELNAKRTDRQKTYAAKGLGYGAVGAIHNYVDRAGSLANNCTHVEVAFNVEGGSVYTYIQANMLFKIPGIVSDYYGPARDLSTLKLDGHVGEPITGEELRTALQLLKSKSVKGDSKLSNELLVAGVSLVDSVASVSLDTGLKKKKDKDDS